MLNLMPLFVNGVSNDDKASDSSDGDDDGGSADKKIKELESIIANMNSQ